MRVETLYFDSEGKRVGAREGVTGEVRQYDDDGRLVLTVHLESVTENDRRRWYQVRALGTATPARNRRIDLAEDEVRGAVAPAQGLAAPTAEQAG